MIYLYVDCRWSREPRTNNQQHEAIKKAFHFALITSSHTLMWAHEEEVVVKKKEREGERGVFMYGEGSTLIMMMFLS